MSGRITLGEKLEKFYLSLLTCQQLQQQQQQQQQQSLQQALYHLAYTLGELEAHKIDSSDNNNSNSTTNGESFEIHQEILKDARKKACLLIPNPFYRDNQSTHHLFSETIANQSCLNLHHLR